jgi:hypothetical protein
LGWLIGQLAGAPAQIGLALKVEWRSHAKESTSLRASVVIPKKEAHSFLYFRTSTAFTQTHFPGRVEPLRKLLSDQERDEQ